MIKLDKNEDLGWFRPGSGGGAPSQLTIERVAKRKRGLRDVAGLPFVRPPPG